MGFGDFGGGFGNDDSVSEFGGGQNDGGFNGGGAGGGKY